MRQNRADAATIRHNFGNTGGAFVQATESLEEYLSAPSRPLPDDHPIFRDIVSAVAVTAENIDHLTDLANNVPSPKQVEMDELGLAVDMQQVERMCELIEKGTPRASAARAVGLMPATLTNLLKLGRQPPSRHPVVEERRVRMAEVCRRLAAAEALLESKLGNTAVALALGETKIDEQTGEEIEVRRPDRDMLKFVLDRRFPKGWSAQSTVKHKGTVDHHLHVSGGRGAPSLNPKDMTDAQLAVVEGLILDMQQTAERQGLGLPAPDVEDVELLDGGGT